MRPGCRGRNSGEFAAAATCPITHNWIGRIQVKAFWTVLLLAMVIWSAPASANYCRVDNEDSKTSCIYKADRIPKGTQIIISYTRQGFSMMIVVFRDEFAIIEGDAKVQTRHGEPHTIKYVSTRRDMTHGKMMEAALYLVDEEVLQELGQARGKIHFYLANTDAKKDVDVEVAASNFEDIADYIAETKSVLSVLFDEQ